MRLLPLGRRFAVLRRFVAVRRFAAGRRLALVRRFPVVRRFEVAPCFPEVRRFEVVRRFTAVRFFRVERVVAARFLRFAISRLLSRARTEHPRVHARSVITTAGLMRTVCHTVANGPNSLSQ